MSEVIKEASKSLADGNLLDDVLSGFSEDARLAEGEAERLKIAFQNFNTEGKKANEINTGVTASLQGLTGGLSKAAVKQAVMNTALNAMVSIGIGAALTLIAKGYQYLAEYQEKTIETGREATNAIKESNKAYQENTKWIEQNADRYAELAKGVERGVNLSLTTAEFDEYNKLSQEIAANFPELVIGYDSLGNSILACGDDVTKLNAALAEQKDNKLAKTLNQTKEIVDAFETESNPNKTFLQALGFGDTTIGQESVVVDTLLASSANQKDFIKAYNTLSIDQHSLMSEMYKNAGVEINNTKDYFKNIDVLINKSKELKQAQSEAAEGMQELASAYLQNDVVFKTFGEDAQNALLNIADNLSYDFFATQNMTTAKDFKDWSNEAAQAINNGGLQKSLNDIFSVSQSSVTKNSFADLNEDIQKVANALKIEDLEDFKLKLGFDEEMFDASFEAAKDNLMAELNEEFASDTAITDWLNTLTQAELDIVANFELRGTESLDYLKQKVASTLALTKDLENLSSGVDKALGGYDIVTTALSELNSEGRITSETLEELQGILGNVEGTFQYTSQGIQVNAQALKQMADNAAEATLTEIEMREALDVIEYQKKTAELNKYCEAHEGLQEALENNSLSEYNDGIEDVNDQLSEFEISTIEALYASTTALAENINGYDELEMRIHAAASALNDYVRAQETANASDNMQTAAGGLEGAKELYKQGWTTKDDYTSYMDYIGYQGKGTDNYVKHAEELFKRAGRYLTEDASGVHKFINDMISEGIEGVEGTDFTNVKFTPKVDLDNVAKEMDMTLDFVTDMFLAMRDAGYEVNFSSLTEGIVDGLTSIDSASETARTDLEGFRQQIDKLAEAGVDVTELEAIYTEVANAIQGNPINFDPTLASLDELTAKSEDARQSIDELANNAGVPFEFKADLNGDVGAIKSQLESLQEFKDTQLTVGTEEWKNANILIAQTVGQLHEAENQVILDIDTSKLDAKSSTVVELIKQFRELQNEKEVNLAVNPNFDTKDIDSKLEGVRSELASLNDPEYTTITTTLGLDKSSVESLNESIKQITPEITAKFMGLSEDGGTINIDGNTAQYDAKLAAAKQRGDSTVVTMQITGDTGQLILDANAGKSYIEGLDPDISVGADTTTLKSDIRSALTGPFSISVNANVSGLPGQKSPANGTAHSGGTVWHYPHAFSEGSALWQHYRNASHQAYAGGNWGLHQNEQGALINELGPEIIVRDGRWFTVNNGYPTLTDLKAGDIIFNHKQSEAILSKGYVTGSHGKLLGKSHADGTVGGSAFNTYVTGGGTNLVKPVTGSSSKKSSSKVVSTSKKTTKKTKKALDAIADWFDWIEIRLDRLARDSENAEKAIDRATGIGKTLAAVNTAISAINTEHDAAEKGAARYLKAAQTVAKNTGLSADLQKKVQNGTIDISKYSETTQKKISEYQKYYEKYLDCLDLVADLEDQAIELAISRLDKITEYYDAVNSVHESLIDANDAKLDYREAKGYSAVSDAQRELLQSSIDEAKAIQANAYSNYTQYQDEFTSLVKAGVLKKDSVEYYDRLSEINDLKAAYYEASTAVLEHADALREIEYTKLQHAIDGFSRASEKLSNQVELLESRNEKVAESIYTEQIGKNNSQIQKQYELRQTKLAEQANYAVNSVRYQELADEISDIDGEIINLLTDNEELKNSIVELRFDPLIESVEKLQDVRSELEDFMDLINEEALFDSDTGALTGEGVANIYLIEQAMNSAKQEIAEYTEGLAKLDENFANGNVSQEEFNEMNAEYREGIRDAIKDVKSYADTLSDLYITQMEKENELLQEIIDKRKEALKRKEDYYNYDKTLRNQNKELNLLKAQAAALEGV